MYKYYRYAIVSNNGVYAALRKTSCSFRRRCEVFTTINAITRASPATTSVICTVAEWAKVLRPSRNVIGIVASADWHRCTLISSAPSRPFNKIYSLDLLSHKQRHIIDPSSGSWTSSPHQQFLSNTTHCKFRRVSDGPSVYPDNCFNLVYFDCFCPSKPPYQKYVPCERRLWPW